MAESQPESIALSFGFGVLLLIFVFCCFELGVSVPWAGLKLLVLSSEAQHSSVWLMCCAWVGHFAALVQFLFSFGGRCVLSVAYGCFR